MFERPLDWCSVLVILRPQLPSLSGTAGTKWYSFIGEAYLCSKMDGEALYDGQSSNDMDFKMSVVVMSFPRLLYSYFAA